MSKNDLHTNEIKKHFNEMGQQIEREVENSVAVSQLAMEIAISKALEMFATILERRANSPDVLTPKSLAEIARQVSAELRRG